jgi:hypothetical protein
VPHKNVLTLLRTPALLDFFLRTGEYEKLFWEQWGIEQEFDFEVLGMLKSKAGH